MSSDELLIEEAKRRIEAHNNLPRYLEIVLSTAREIDPESEVYIFGSVAEGRSLPSSDIDILIVTEKDAAEILPKLWERGVKTPFEIHVVKKNALEIYRRKTKLIKAEDYLATSKIPLAPS
ncbi:nucleotidyltransferase domain-containing protein [Thermoproteus uzoniensis]|uniref:nucleotidyltransferase domain-containing protein n=1 Tax=Thermoproteus uzoniensis TaxID=184117 RepID=UPI00069AEB41|nr:nucleotidyltransferase domain-containing protein [Thermoproteus uzoniensis]